MHTNLATTALVCLLGSSLLRVNTLAAQSNRVNICLLAGQSNADGRGETSGLPTAPINLQLPQSDVPYYFQTEGNVHGLLENSVTTLRPGTTETSVGGTSHFGPEIGFGRSMADFFAEPSDPSVAIIK